MIAALYVATGGCYFDLPGVDPWDEQRDARLYPGPHPVVAHPPCARWCRLAGLCEARYGIPKGEDGGTFASALANVRKWGGILEHPAYTNAWRAHDLTPPTTKGWQRTFDGGFVAHVDQGNYGHKAAKPTWLYAFGVDDLPPLRTAKVITSWVVSTTARWGTPKREIPKPERIATPLEFRDLLLGIARSVR